MRVESWLFRCQQQCLAEPDAKGRVLLRPISTLANVLFLLGQNYFLGQALLRPILLGPSSTWANFFKCVCVVCVRCVGLLCGCGLCVWCVCVCLCVSVCCVMGGRARMGGPDWRGREGGPEAWGPKRTLWVVHGRDPRPQFHEKTPCQV